MLAVFLQKVQIVTDLTALRADPATACLACAEKKPLTLMLLMI